MTTPPSNSISVCDELQLAATWDERSCLTLWTPSRVPTLWVTITHKVGPYGGLL